MSLSSYRRRMPVSSLADLERQGRGSVGGGGTEFPFFRSLHCLRNPSPFPSYSPNSIGGSLGEGGSIIVREGSSRAGSFTFSRVLQLNICSDEGLRVVETSNRFVHTQSESPQNSFQDGDPPVCASICPERRLDGVHRLEGCLLPNSYPFGQLQASQIRGFESSFSIQSSVLRSFYGSAGFHSGHGSGLGSSTSSGYPHVSLPGRLASSGLLSSSSSPGLGDGAPAVSRPGDCYQLGEIQPDSSPESGVSWSESGLHSFQGFSLPAERREAMLNRRRIPVLRQAARFFVEEAARNSVFPDGDHSRGTVTNAIPSASTSSSLGSGGRFLHDSIESGVSPGPGMVGRAGSSSVGHFSGSGQPSPRLLVRRLGHGVSSLSSG